MKAISSIALEVEPALREALMGALGPEIGAPPEATVVKIETMEKNMPGMILTIRSDDMPSHRAALNSYLGLLQASLGALTGSFEKNKYEEQFPRSGG